jgi:hypothetical protein
MYQGSVSGVSVRPRITTNHGRRFDGFSLREDEKSLLMFFFPLAMTEFPFLFCEQSKVWLRFMLRRRDTLVGYHHLITVASMLLALLWGRFDIKVNKQMHK